MVKLGVEIICDLKKIISQSEKSRKAKIRRVPPKRHPKLFFHYFVIKMQLFSRRNVVPVVKLQRSVQVCLNVLVNQNDDSVCKNIASVN